MTLSSDQTFVCITNNLSNYIQSCKNFSLFIVVGVIISNLYVGLHDSVLFFHLTCFYILKLAFKCCVNCNTYN